MSDALLVPQESLLKGLDPTWLQDQSGVHCAWAKIFDKQEEPT